MHEMTATHLRSAHGGESMAHMRYLIWADKATADGFPNVARLFRAIAFAEQVHATNHFAALANEVGPAAQDSGGVFGLGPTGQNLAGALAGETFEINEMYPVYLNAAEFQGEAQARLSFHYALSAEKIHAAMYMAAKKAVDGGKDYQIGPIHICDKCGYTGEGRVPDRCPVCSATKERFRSFE